MQMASDIKEQHFFFRISPLTWHAYLRLIRIDRPVGTWLLFLPCLWSLSLAHKNLNTATIEYIKSAALFGLGAFLMRSAGCIINDLWDRDLDAKVERTKTRPLASGAISIKKALIFLSALLTCALGVLLQFNLLTIALGFASFFLVLLYPLMKRVTWWPQLFLGLTFNWGALMGYTALTGKIETPAIFLYMVGIFWTLAYDTIYACQDAEDDALIGIKSTALLFGDKVKIWVGGFFVLSLGFLAFSTNNILFLLPAFMHAGWQIYSWNKNSPSSSLQIFKSNIYFGLFVWLAVYF
jgi:4-hydroxybenzoate polyprenyltransferase